MTTTYELYTNENGTPKAVEGKAPAILERVEALETSVESLEETLDNGVVTSVNSQTGDVTVDVGVTSVNGNTGDITPKQTGCLPLSGGTMTDEIKSGATYTMSSNVTNKSIRIFGSSSRWGGGAVLVLNGEGATGAGQFWLSVNDGTNNCYLKGFPNKSLTWDNKEIERVNSSGADWIRFESGVQFCFFSHTFTANGEATITFPVAFSNANVAVTASYSHGVAISVSSIASTHFTVGGSITSGNNVKVIAIGKWK